jgi:hypothetical protein
MRRMRPGLVGSLRRRMCRRCRLLHILGRLPLLLALRRRHCAAPPATRKLAALLGPQLQTWISAVRQSSPQLCFFLSLWPLERLPWSMAHRRGANLFLHCCVKLHSKRCRIARGAVVSHDEARLASTLWMRSSNTAASSSIAKSRQSQRLTANMRFLSKSGPLAESAVWYSSPASRGDSDPSCHGVEIVRLVFLR